MKTLKVLTIVALTGTIGLMAGSGDYQEKNGCTNQYTIAIGNHVTDRKIHRKNLNRRINRLLRKLDLSEAQKSKLKEIRTEMQQSRKIEQKKYRGSMRLQKFVSVDGFDREGFIHASTDRAARMAKRRADMLEKFITVLTPEQRLELVERLQKRGKRNRHQAK